MGDLEVQVSSNTKLYNLIKKCIDYLDTETIRLVLQDHDYDFSIDEIDNMISYVRQRQHSKVLLDAASYRAQEKCIDFTLDQEWVLDRLSNGICEKTGIKFVYTQYGSGVPNPYAPSIDRIDNSKGYTKENSRLVIIAFNKFKSDYREEDIDNIIKELCLLS